MESINPNDIDGYTELMRQFLEQNKQVKVINDLLISPRLKHHVSFAIDYVKQFTVDIGSGDNNKILHTTNLMLAHLSLAMEVDNAFRGDAKEILNNARK